MLGENVNVARRLSARNEVDLLQENFMDDEDEKYTRSYCEAIAQKITLVNKVPNECKDFSSVMSIIRRREETQSNHARAFEGMTPGEAQAAMAAREKGHLNPMQIQRRMTNRNSRRVW